LRRRSRRAQDEGRGFPHQYAQTRLGSPRHAPKSSQAGHSRVQLRLRGGGS
jgi:hypothetical protein